MPKGYWIVRAEVRDMEKYKEYVTAAAPALQKYGAKVLVRAGKFENPEGTSRPRNGIIEFPSYEKALECWRSAEYQAAIKLRQPVSTMDMVIIEGLEG
ncbi:MAG: DUF1330 domain-containing protein [Deltaproteobacteria bacterium]|nr:DUF1330 domain-containing protein [Deltaproteobacteria bacterium]